MPAMKRKLSHISDPAPPGPNENIAQPPSHHKHAVSLQAVRDTPTIYEPLDSQRKEIRVLEVESGTGDEPLVCDLRRVSLLAESMPCYETISYVWGDKALRGTIRICGQDRDIPASSEAALRRMRYPDRPRVLWIDAVCINQEDQVERGHQVTFMQNIYGNGQRNLIWLGDDDGCVGPALADIERLVDNMKAETHNFENAENMLFRAHGGRNWTKTSLAVDVQDWSALDEFYQNPWFLRLWVIQEATLSRSNTCYFGPHEFKLEHVLRAAVWLTYKQHSLSKSINTHGATKIAAFADKICGSSTRYRDGDLQMLLSSLAMFNVSDPRDHVFALLGLTSIHGKDRELSASITPDYLLSTATVFRDTTRLIIEQHGTLVVLNDVSSRLEADLDEWPSWVPRWDQRDAVFDRGRLICTNFDACKEPRQPLPLREVEDPNVIALAGVVVDSVAEVNEMLPYLPRQISGSEQHLMEVLDSAHRLVFQAQIGRSRVDAMEIVAPTLLGSSDIRAQRLSVSESVELYQAYREYLSLSTYLDGKNLYSVAHALEDQAVEYHSAMRRAVSDRCLFSTSSGRFGFGLPSVQVGDLVVILHGGAAPFIIRKLQRDSKEAMHEFIGVCFVHGIMDWEAVLVHEEDRKEDEWFYLR